MLYYLVFCATAHYGMNCNTPQRFENIQACQAVGNALLKSAKTVYPYSGIDHPVANAKCIGVKK